MEYRDQQELQEQAEYGRKAKIAIEILNDFLKNSRSIVLQSLEGGNDLSEEVLNKVMYLRILKKFEHSIQTAIQIGELAEQELNKDGK